MPLTSYERGLVSELVAALWLFIKGYRLRRWRYKTAVGEIDLIASKGKTLVFIEVKHRPTLDQGLEAISAKSRNRIIRASEQYLATEGGNWDHIRFDVITVAGLRMRHLDNAWFRTT